MHSVETLLGRMDHHIASWEKEGDSRLVFLRCYNMMSRNMFQAVKKGHFSDPNWVTYLIIRFSDYYFEALNRYEDLSPQTPKVWKEVHDITLQQKLHVVQSLLIGVNAHINYDLPLALYDCLEKEWPTLNQSLRISRKKDHNEVNIIIAQTIDAIQDDIIAPLSPAMALVDKFLGRVDEWLLSKLITGWRTNVWDVTQSLLHATSDADREVIRFQLELKVLKMTKQIIKVI